MENWAELAQTFATGMTMWSGNSISTYTEKLKTVFQMCLPPTFTSVLFIKTNIYRQPTCPPTWEWNDCDVCMDRYYVHMHTHRETHTHTHIFSEIWFFHMQEEIFNCDNMDKTGIHCISKKQTEREILYDITYIWTLKLLNLEKQREVGARSWVLGTDDMISTGTKFHSLEQEVLHGQHNV